MEFRLIYEGPLHGQGAKSLHKWEIRRALHPQLQRLWREHPLKNAADRLLAHPALPGQTSVVVEKGGLLFAPLVTQRLNLYAELSVLLFRQQPRGTLITDGGDIDNLFDRFYNHPQGGAYVGQGMTMAGTAVPWGVRVPGMGRSFNVGVTVKF